METWGFPLRFESVYIQYIVVGRVQSLFLFSIVFALSSSYFQLLLLLTHRDDHQRAILKAKIEVPAEHVEFRSTDDTSTATAGGAGTGAQFTPITIDVMTSHFR